VIFEYLSLCRTDSFSLISFQSDITFITVSHVDEVLQAAFDGGFMPAVTLEDVNGAITSKL